MSTAPGTRYAASPTPARSSYAPTTSSPSAPPKQPPTHRPCSPRSSPRCSDADRLAAASAPTRRHRRPRFAEEEGVSMTAVIPIEQDTGRIAVLEEIEQRVLWLATAIIDHPDGPQGRWPSGVVG